MSKQHLPEEDDVGYVIGAEYSSPIKLSPELSLAPTEDSSFTCHEQSDSPILTKRNSSTADARLAMASNYSAAYNTFNISLALALMRSSHPPHTSSDITSCSSAVIAGMIVGQLIGGLLGDWLGRHIAMSVVMCVQVISALMSAFSGTLFLTHINNDASIYTELACWRFFLGFGCGGVYPLSATITAESSSQKGNRPRLLAKMFSMQGVAYLAVPLIAYVLVLMFGDGSDLAWRLLLGMGSLPGLILIVTRLYRRRNSLQSSNIETETIKQQKTRHGRLQPTSMLESIRNEDKLGHKLVGTAGCWLLFDILFYGNALFQPKVLQSAFGQSETEIDLIRDAILIGLMALPGYLISIYMVGRQSPRRIQLQGFLCMAVLYAYIGYNFDSLNKYALLGLYGASFFFSNYGPNTTTFMLPSITFSRPIRSTLNGICAASGKIGALLGAVLFLPLATWVGDAQVILLCACVSIVGAMLTFFFTNDAFEDDQEAIDNSPEGWKRLSSEAHLMELRQQEECYPRRMSKELSMPTFLDLPIELKV